MNTSAYLKINYFLLFVAVLGLLVFFKIIPHLPNFSPQIVLFVLLGSMFSKKYFIVSMIIIAVLSDLASAQLTGYAVFGLWTFFTYSAFILIGVCSNLLKASAQKWSFLIFALSSSFGFWCWTNLESWWFSGMYPHSFEGLRQCYLLALPFLNYSLLAAILWASTIVIIAKNLPRSQISYKPSPRGI